ncbi:hypothetical protein ACFU6K_12005 [Kitasatospora sp. NPDC057512]|uniref:hypothetical protein n=1 Tax=Kitasatospora sp. NPDC057512 TaxID=3346154 RepID=UPI0036B8622A
MAIISGLGPHGRPWPEFMPGHRPALVLPADPGRPLVPEDGWASRVTAPTLGTGPYRGWSAVLTGYQLTIHRPGDAVWFDGEISATRKWWGAARAQGALLLITGPLTSVFDFRHVAATGRLSLLTVPIRLAIDS